MAQLNPNFEIDFDDINSYEQIQLINDTQLAKENLLMHRAYKEPSDDEIIRNQFSSFTFVDFCPKLFTSTSTTTLPATATGELNSQKLSNTENAGSSSLLRCAELESFSDLFERINSWLKLNKEWRVVSMQTLVYDNSTQFNHLKSSIHSRYLPKNTRGLRLFLSPSKSRFSGPQKIGCINVVPRKVSGSHSKLDEPPVYETLDEILTRLNELLLTRPIEGRILSVETITLPIINGYVNTESNYFMDLRLNLLNELTYSSPNSHPQPQHHTHILGDQQSSMHGHHLIDILRVYYEFGPVVCGLVNLIDFLPRFYSPTPTTDTHNQNNQNSSSLTTSDVGASTSELGSSIPSTDLMESTSSSPSLGLPKIPATESMTRLIRRALAWFEYERKLIMEETECNSEKQQILGEQKVNLKVCNLQVYQKILPKSELIQIDEEGKALSAIKTRQMLHERINLSQTFCARCSSSGFSSQSRPENSWCLHLVELSQPYEVKFIRLAYVVPVYNKYARMCPLRVTSPNFERGTYWAKCKEPKDKKDNEETSLNESSSRLNSLSVPHSEISGSLNSLASSSSSSTSLASQNKSEQKVTNEGVEQKENDELKADELKADEEEDEAKEAALGIVGRTTKRHLSDEIAHQLRESDNCFKNSPIGQLTYRLFAPCQLVSSSSCFSINPINSSSPLSRRGSVNLSGSAPRALSSTIHPTSADAQLHSANPFFATGQHKQSNDPLECLSSSSSSKTSSQQLTGNRFTTNEFESVDAIRRRMEIYVTTNSMKVIAGETIIVNLSDALSCLSTAIEQTVVKLNFTSNQEPSTWVSVYVLYAAVEEPQMPEQLLAQQKAQSKKLSKKDAQVDLLNDKLQHQQLISSEEAFFNDHFECEKEDVTTTDESGKMKIGNKEEEEEEENRSSFIRIEQNPNDSSLTLYNSAYDRTIALPTPPENQIHVNNESFEMFASLADCLWDTNILAITTTTDSKSFQRNKSNRRRRRGTKSSIYKRQDESQCSIM